jgi:membrane dipeptidase
MPRFASRADAHEAAIELLDRAPLIDGHNDLPYVIHAANGGDVAAYDITRRTPKGDTDIPRLQAGHVGTQVFTAFLPTFAARPVTTRLLVFDTMLQMERLYPDVFHPVLSADDVGRAKRMKKIGLLKAVEGLTGIGTELQHLSVLEAMGCRLVTLCHNETLDFIDSATDVARVAGTLSAFGERVVQRIEDLRMIVDLAHASADAQLHVLDVATKPLVISHANARALCPHPRNAPDAVMRRVADRGGVVMATFVPAFLNPHAFARVRRFQDAYGKTRADVTEADLAAAGKAALATWQRDGVAWCADHLEHMRTVVGEEHLGIGSDFYGGPNPPGLDDASTFPALFAELLVRGWSEQALLKLAGRNFLRVFRAVGR